MKYRDLIQFNPIETIIELRSSDDQRKAEELVRSYVMSDSMAELIQTRILSQLSLDQVVDNKGVLLVGNYGTGKSHLMSVISAIASSKAFLPLAQNKRFQEDAKDIAGQFEVLRIEIGSTEKSLRGIITDCLEQDLKKRGITFSFPDVSTINNNKDALMAMMAAFAKKYGQRGYLVVVDELLDYLKSRKDNELMLDINFLREIGEIIKTTRLRFISGVQEALFENPVFHHVSNSLLKMKDRYEQVLIRSEDIAAHDEREAIARAWHAGPAEVSPSIPLQREIRRLVQSRYDQHAFVFFPLPIVRVECSRIKISQPNFPAAFLGDAGGQGYLNAQGFFAGYLIIST